MSSSLFKDGEGNFSSFRVGWFVFLIIIVATWSFLSIDGGEIQPWPMDGITTMGIIFGPGVKTVSEKMNFKPKA